MWVRVGCLAIGYLFGLFQTSYIYGKAHGIDIRNYGSGNAGTTNMMRTLGTKAGLITFFGDCVKCMLAVGLVCLLFGKSHSEMLPLLKMYAAAGTILGHNFPFYLQFHGGKGIAATAGLVLSFDPTLLAKLPAADWASTRNLEIKALSSRNSCFSTFTATKRFSLWSFAL